LAAGRLEELLEPAAMAVEINPKVNTTATMDVIRMVLSPCSSVGWRTSRPENRRAGPNSLLAQWQGAVAMN